MIKWLVVIAVVVLASGLIDGRRGRRLRLGELPGDLQLRVGKRQLSLPFTSTLLLSLFAWLLFRAL